MMYGKYSTGLVSNTALSLPHGCICHSTPPLLLYLRTSLLTVLLTYACRFLHSSRHKQDNCEVYSPAGQDYFLMYFTDK